MSKKDNKEKNNKLPPTNVDEEVEIPTKDLRKIVFSVNCCEHLKPKYSATDIVINVQFMKQDIWHSSKIPVTDDDYLIIDQFFTMTCDLLNKKELDNLITFPVTFTITEYPGEMNPEIYAQLTVTPVTPEEPQITCAESAANLSDMLQDEKIDRTTFIADVKKGKNKGKQKPEKGKEKKEKKDTSSAKGSKKDSKGSKKSKESSDKSFELKPPSGPHEAGFGCIDVIPLFLGKKDFSEKIVLHQQEKTEDDTMTPKECLPTLSVTVFVDTPWFEEDQQKSVFHLTLEAAYNLPSITMTNMDYLACTHVMQEGGFLPYVSIGAKTSNVINREKIKYWPPVTSEDTYLERTKYRIESGCGMIRNKIDVNLENYLNEDVPKIEWNTLKRFFMSSSDNANFLSYIKRFRRIGLEFLIYPKQEETAKMDEKSGKKGGKGKDTDKGKGPKKETSAASFNEYFHFMTFIDVSSLLYPGVNKVRVVCPIRTYQEVEFGSIAGIKDSFFIPKPPEVPIEPVVYKGGKGAKDSNPSSKGSSKKGDSKKGVNVAPPQKTNLNNLLPPPPPPPPEPSLPVYNDMGEQAFIIIEIELLHPINPQRQIENLSEKLTKIIPKRPTKPKSVIDSILSEEIYKDTIKNLSENLTRDYKHFLQDQKDCKCEFEESEQNSFLNYLNKTGVYQTYFTSILKSTSLIAEKRFPFNGETDFGNKHYLNHISKVYTYLVSEMNEVLNSVVTYNINKQYSTKLKNIDMILFFAKEASELHIYKFARKYYIKRICSAETNPNCWLDFAIFNLEMEDVKQAIECVQEALAVDPDHCHSLILYGILLSKKGQSDQAETCFLSALSGNPRWLEGWGAAHIFYLSIENVEGADFCLEMANKYIETDTKKYSCEEEDLSWTTKICPNTVYFRTAALFIKFRAFALAELALSFEIIKEPGLCHYYLAVIMYLKKNYDHALVHIDETRNFYGLDYAVLSLKGHCLYHLEKHDKAVQNYTRVLELFNRPEDVHLVFVNLSLTYKRLGDTSAALKTILLSCKLSPTACTWLKAGLLYFDKHDFLSAEECFTQANLYDNQVAECWAYLTLVNVYLGRYIEANMCYSQTIKNDLKDVELLENVKKAMKNI